MISLNGMVYFCFRLCVDLFGQALALPSKLFEVDVVVVSCLPRIFFLASQDSKLLLRSISVCL